MSTPPAGLAERHADLTRRSITDAAIDQLQRAPVGELTVRAVAARAGMSERTVFRYFQTHSDLLDAVVEEIGQRLELPPNPSSVEDILAYPAVLYARFENAAPLIKAVLHSDLYDRLRGRNTEQRWEALQRIVDAVAPDRSASDRLCAASNIRYFLTATTWHYYRYYFNLTLEQTIACARFAISQALTALGVHIPPQTAPAEGRPARRSAKRRPAGTANNK